MRSVAFASSNFLSSLELVLTGKKNRFGMPGIPRYAHVTIGCEVASTALKLSTRCRAQGFLQVTHGHRRGALNWTLRFISVSALPRRSATSRTRSRFPRRRPLLLCSRGLVALRQCGLRQFPGYRRDNRRRLAPTAPRYRRTRRLQHHRRHRHRPPAGVVERAR